MKNPARHFLAALGFLTILPVGRAEDFEAGRSVSYFPLVGIVVGLLWVGGDVLFSALVPPPLVSLLDVLMLAVISGGLHLDGLGDSADGLFSHQSRERMLAIMKDSRSGVMAIVAVGAVLAVKWVSIGELDQYRLLYLLLIPAYARGAMMFGIQFFQYGRPEGGTGTDFFLNKPPLWGLATISLPVVVSIGLGWTSISFNLLFVVGGVVLLGLYQKKVQGITGDMLGAMCEVLEAWLLLVACSLGKW